MVSTETVTFMVILLLKKIAAFVPESLEQCNRGTWYLVGVKGVLSLWCLSALLLFRPLAGQQKRGLRVGVCYCTYRHVRRSSSILFSWTGKVITA